MASITKLDVIVNDLDTEVECSFKRRMIEGLKENEDGSSFKQLMEAYLMWKFRDRWGELE